MRLWLTNAKDRTHYHYPMWVKYIQESTGEISIYNNDYYKYLRGVSVIRDLAHHERAYMQAYDKVVYGIKPMKETQ